MVQKIATKRHKKHKEKIILLSIILPKVSWFKNPPSRGALALKMKCEM
jgi:hypothetical protein